MLSGAIEDFIYQRNQGSDAFEGKPLGTQIPLLQHQFEEIGANEQIERSLLINLRLRTFQPVLNPAAAVGIGNVSEFDANGSAIRGAGLLSEFALNLQIGMGLRPEEA